MNRLGLRQLSHELDSSRKLGPTYIPNKAGRYLNKTSRVGGQPAAQPAANLGGPSPRGRSAEPRQPSWCKEVDLGEAAGRERRPSSCRSTQRSRVVSGGTPEARPSTGAWMGAPDRVLTCLQRQPGSCGHDSPMVVKLPRPPSTRITLASRCLSGATRRPAGEPPLL